MTTNKECGSHSRKQFRKCHLYVWTGPGTSYPNRYTALSVHMCVSVCKFAQERHRNAYVCFAKLMQCIRIYTPHEGSHSWFDFKMMKRQIPLTIEEAESWYCSILLLASLPKKGKDSWLGLWVRGRGRFGCGVTIYWDDCRHVAYICCRLPISDADFKAKLSDVCASARVTQK